MNTDSQRMRGWRRWAWPVASAIAVLAVLIVLGNQLAPHARTPASPERTAVPPWVYGNTAARFTVVEYADLECPYCKAYFPVLKRWIDEDPQVNWQWRHLPLPMHEPATMTEARLVECAGESDGAPAFWRAVEWIYGHTGSNGAGIPSNVVYPGVTPAVKACLAGMRADAVIQQQAREATRDGITATPTLQLIDHRTGRALVLSGPVEGDGLLSALDMLAAGDVTMTSRQGATGMPADTVGDMPR